MLQDQNSLTSLEDWTEQIFHDWEWFSFSNLQTISNNLYNLVFVIQLLQDLFYQLARQYLFIFSVVSVTIFCVAIYHEHRCMITSLIITLQDFIHLVWIFLLDLLLYWAEYSQEIEFLQEQNIDPIKMKCKKTDCSVNCHMFKLVNNKRLKIKFKLPSKLLRIYPYFKLMASWLPPPLPPLPPCQR